LIEPTWVHRKILKLKCSWEDASLWNWLFMGSLMVREAHMVKGILGEISA